MRPSSSSKTGLWKIGALVVATAAILHRAQATPADAFSSMCRRLLFPLQRTPVPSDTSTVPPGYHLTFDDEFKDLSLSDEDGAGTRWYTQSVQCCMQDTDHRDSPTQMAGLHAPAGQDPFHLVSGGLRIRLQKTDGRWYSGVIATADRQGNGFAQQYGYFEMKASFPGHKGTWPAFWLLNSAARQRHEPAGEIDVVESYMQFPDAVNTTLLDWGQKANNTIVHHTAKVPDLSQGFHTFGMLWTAETMTFFCDGNEIFRASTPPVMHQPYYPIVDLGLGGGWPTKETPDQSDMIVRYVRVYARQD